MIESHYDNSKSILQFCLHADRYPVAKNDTTPYNRRMNDIVIKNGRVLIGDHLVETDVGLHGDTISTIGEDLEGERTIDATGLLVLPGAIDAHVHFREPGNTHKETFATGSRAAVFGGVTTVFEMPNTWPTTTDADAWYAKQAIANETSYCNFGLFFVHSFRKKHRY